MFKLKKFIFEIEKTKKDKKYQAGITPLLVLVAIAASSIMVFAGGLTVNNLVDNGILNFIDPALKKLISQQADYLDSAKLNKSNIENGVVGTVLLPDGSYSAYKILGGEIESRGTEFTGEVKISFFSDDVGLGDYSNGNISPFYLKDGSITTGVIIDRMLANLNDGETTHVIKILKGAVVNGALVGQFVAQTLDTGYYIGGIVDDTGKITDATVLTGAPRLTEAQISIADNALYALSFFKDISVDFKSAGENKVLGAETSVAPKSSLGKLNKPVFNKNNGTWTFLGNSTGGAVSTSAMQGVVNYIQNVAENISTLPSAGQTMQQVVQNVIQGIGEIKSTNSKLTVSTENNVATLSLDLSGITASGVSDGSVGPAGIVHSNSPTNGQCLTYNSSTGGFTWGSCGTGGGGSITGVTAGYGLTGGGSSGNVSLVINPQTGGGLEAAASGISLTRECSDGEILKWTESTSSWECAADNGGSGGGVSTLQVDDSTVVSSATVIDFLGTDFDLTNSPSGEGNLSIDYTNSKIVRSNQNLSVTGAWTFSTAPVISTVSNTGTLTLPTSTDTLIGRNTSDTLTNKTIAAGSNTISGLGVGNFSSANISQWTNNSGYISGNQTITLSGDLSGSGATSINATIGSGAVSLSKMANLAANSIIGNNTGSAATPVALTITQVKSMLSIANTDVSGLGTMSTQNSNSVSITGGSLSGLTSVSATTFTGSLTGNASTVTGLSVTSGKTLTLQKSMTLTAADDTGVYTFPTGTATLLSTTGSAANLTNFPTFNQNTTGTAAGLSSILVSTSGGSGVNNAGTLTWGAGGTLGTAAYTASSDYATSAQGTLATNALPSASFTDAAVTGKLLTGYVSGAGTVSATDSILQAIQKLNGNDATNANLTGVVTSVGNATSIADGAITNAMLANAAVANLSGTNTGDNAVNSNYASDYRASNFVAGTNYLAPTGSAASLTNFPTFNQDTTGNAATVTNGVYTNGSYSDPSWITSLSPTKVLPDQTGQNGKVLSTNGSVLSWITNSSGVAWGAITGTLSNQTDLNSALSGKLGTSLTSANIFVGNGSNVATGVAMSGDITIDNTGATTIGSGKVGLSKIANIADATILGNNSGSAGAPIALTATQVKTLLSIANTDVSGLGTMSTQNSNSVSISGGTMNGVTIGGTTRAGGNFTTLDSNGSITLGDANSDTLTIKAGSSGTGITFFDSSFANCSALETAGGVLTCGSDDTGAGGGISTIQIGDSDIVTSATTIDFLAADFDVTNSPTGEGNVSIDYTNSKITRSDQTQSITGAWTFSDLTISDTNVPLTGASLTLDFNNAADRTLTLTNSSGGVANLSVEGTISASNFSGSSSGTNTGDNATNSNYASDYRAANFVAGTNYLAPTGSAASLTNFPTFNQNTTGTASNITGVLGASSFPAMTGDVTNTQGSLSTTIGSGAVTLGKMANLAANSIIGNNTGSAATPIALTASQVKTLLGISTTDVSGLGNIATQSAGNVFITGGNMIGLNGVSATTFTGALSGNATTATTGNALANTDAAGQSAITAINSATSGTINSARIGTLPYISTSLTSANIIVGNGSGQAAAVTMSGDVTIDNTGATTIGNSKVTLGKIANIANNTILGNNSGSAAAPIALTGSQIKTILGITTSDVSGLGTMSTQNSNNVSITGGSLSGLTSVSATTFTGALSGNASSADTATTATTANALANSDSTGQSAIAAINSATTGTINTARLNSAVTTQGNTFNGVSQLVKLDSSGNLPAVGGASLTGLTKSQVGLSLVENTALSTWAGSTNINTIADKTVTLARMADMATGSFLGRNTVGSGAPEVLSISTVKSMLSLGTGDISGLGTIATQSANNVFISGGNMVGLTSVSATTFTGALTGNASTVTGLSVTSGKTLTAQKSMTFTASDDTGVYTFPTGTATLLSTTGSAASLTNFPTLNQNTSGTAAGLSSILTSTMGGSGVNNAGTLTWGSGGTLGTAAYTASSDYATSAQGTLATNALPSASFTDTAVTGKLLTGYTSGAGTVAATDSILQAIQKLNGNEVLNYDSGNFVAGTNYLTPTGSAASLTNFPTLNQNTTGTAAGLSSVLGATYFPALDGDVTTTQGDLTTTIANGVVTLSKMADMATASFLGRNTAGSGTPEVLSVSTVKSMLSLGTGDISGLGTIATQSAGNIFVTGGQMSGLTSISATTFTGALTGNASTATTATTANALANSDSAGQSAITAINSATSGTINSARIGTLPYISTSLSSGNIIVGNGSGVATGVSMSGDITIDNTGATTIGNSKVTLGKIANIGSNTILGNKTAGDAAPTALSVSDIKTMLAYTSGDLGLGTIATQSAGNVFITGGNLIGLNQVTATNFTGALTGNASTVTGLSVTSGKTLTLQKSMTFTAADDTGVYTFPTGTATLLSTTGSAANLTNFPTFNQNTTGTAAGLSSILTSTMGGSGVNNAGTLTWGSGGTLGTAAYTAITDYATAAQGTLATNALPSASFTDAAVTGKLLTGYTSGAGTVSATDSILQAIQKLNGNDATNANLTGVVTSVGNATSIANGAITNAMLANSAVANLSGTNTGDNATNSNYASDYRAANFVAGTNYLAPNGSAASLTNFPTLNQDTTGNAATVTGFSPTTGKVLTLQKSMTFTAADDTGVYTLPTGIKTLVATDVSTLSSLTSIGTLTNLTVTNAISGSVTGNAGTVTNGVYDNGSYSNPTWITALSPTKVLPDQTGQNGKVLSTNGSVLSWVTNSSGVAWGAITGTLADQTDLSNALNAKLGTGLASANIFVGNGSGVATGVSMSGDITIDNTGATTIGNSKVTLGKIANIADGTILGNNSGSAGAPIALTASQIKTILGISTSDVSGLGTMATQNSNSVSITGGSMSGLTSVSATTFTGALSGNATTATTGNALANTDAAGQSAITAINSATSGTINSARIGTLPYISTSLTSANLIVGNASGQAAAVTMSGDITIDNTGLTAIGSGKVSLGKMANLAANSIIGNNTGSAATPIALSATQVKSLLSIANTDVSGLGTMSTQNSNSVSISGGSISGVTIGGTASGLTFAAGSNTLSGITATNMTAGDFSSVVNTGSYSINVSGSAGSVTGLSVTSGKTLTVQKSITFTAADDTGVYTFPTGTKTLVATDVTSLSSLTSVGTLSSLSSSGTVTIGSGGNTFTFDPTSTSGMAYAGTVRPTRKETMAPEYQGAVLTGTGTGTMTSDFCDNNASNGIADVNTGDCNTNETHNFYKWTTSQGTAQTYSIYLRWRIPDNFPSDGFSAATNPVQVYGRRSDATNGSVKVYVYDTAGALNNAGGTEVAGTANTWNQGNISVSGGTWTAGSYMTIKIDVVAAASGGTSYAGEINLNYRSTN